MEEEALKLRTLDTRVNQSYIVGKFNYSQVPNLTDLEDLNKR